MKKIICFTISTACLVFVCNAAAQDSKLTAAPPAVTTAVANLPKHSCTQPEPISKLASDRQQKQFTKEVDAYRDCLMGYEKEMRARAIQNRDAANAAVQEFNDFANSLMPQK